MINNVAGTFYSIHKYQIVTVENILQSLSILRDIPKNNFTR